MELFVRLSVSSLADLENAMGRAVNIYWDYCLKDRNENGLCHPIADGYLLKDTLANLQADGKIKIFPIWSGECG
ncbi:MAG: hypothetical protein ACLU94_11995 [Catenibacillus sp.]